MPAPSSVDIALRQQMVTDRVKASQYSKAATLRADIEETLRERFAGVISKGTFGNMSRGEFQNFLSNVVKDASAHLVEYKLDAMDFLEELTGEERILAQNVYETLSGKKLEDIERAQGTTHGPQAAKDLDTLWARLSSRQMAANGLTMEQTLQSGSDYTMGLIVRRLRQAQADNEDIGEALKAILGDDALGNKDGLLNKLENAYKAGSNTNIQNVASGSQAAVASVFYDFYQWVSTLDDRTTAICRGRDGNIYKYGEGPLPPAHWNCRSTTVPASAQARKPSPASQEEWLSGQPKKVQTFLRNPKPLHLDKLQTAAKIILQGFRPR